MILKYMLDGGPPSRSDDSDARPDEEEDRGMTRDFTRGRLDQCCHGRHLTHMSI